MKEALQLIEDMASFIEEISFYEEALGPARIDAAEQLGERAEFILQQGSQPEVYECMVVNGEVVLEEYPPE